MKSDFTLHSNLLFKKPLCTAGTQSTPQRGRARSFLLHTPWLLPYCLAVTSQAFRAGWRKHQTSLLGTPLVPQGEGTEKTGHSLPFLPASSCLSCSTLCPHPFITHKRQREKLSPGARQPSQPPSGFCPKQQAARQWDLRGKLRLPE